MTPTKIQEKMVNSSTFQKILVNSKALGMYRLKTSIKTSLKRNEKKKIMNSWRTISNPIRFKQSIVHSRPYPCKYKNIQKNNFSKQLFCVVYVKWAIYIIFYILDSVS